MNLAMSVSGYNPTHLSSGIALFELIKESLFTAWTIVKIVLPITVALEVLKFVGWMVKIASLFEPLVAMLGIPGEFGTVWAVGMFAGIYGGLGAFVTILGTNAASGVYSVAEITALSMLFLSAHNVIVETRIAKLLGAKAWRVVAFRLLTAVIFVWIFIHLCQWFNILQTSAKVLIPIEQIEPESLWDVLINPVIINLEMMVIIVLSFLILAFLKHIKVTLLLEWSLNPLTKLLQINRRLTSSLLVGILIGLSYSGALLIKDFKELKDVGIDEKIKVIYFVTILHALIEDTILMLILGADLFVILVIRVIYCISVMVLFNLCIRLKKSVKNSL